MTLAILCSGQGRQDRGMLDLLKDAPPAERILAKASALLEKDVRYLLAEATEATLHSNRTSQVLCVTRALAAAACIAPSGPFLVAGYSVGEVAAWSIAGFWSAEQALDLVATRARLMDEAGGSDDRLGFIRGLSRDKVDSLLAVHDCAIAIINPNQVFVIGGERNQVERCCAAALQDGAAAARPIDVHVASHTARLSTAVDPFFAVVKGMPFAPSTPGRTLLGASDGSVVQGSKGIPGFARQIATKIDWAATLEALVERGITRVIELGPGTALADMVQATYPRIDSRALDHFRTLEGVAAWLAA